MADDSTTDGTQPDDAEGLFAKLKDWCRDDLETTEKWRGDAKEDFGFVSGEGQWTEEDKQKLRDQLRPVITMNRIDPIIDSVSGSEVANRQEVRYLPREQGDVQVNEVLTSAAQWFRDQCDAEDEESDAFRDTLICGMGWTETRLDYEVEPDGEPKVERVDPLQMVWDSSATKRNIADCRRMFHIRRKIPLDEAKALVAATEELEDADYHAAWVEDLGDGDEIKNIDNTNRYADKDGGEDDDGDDKLVTLVRAQWWEREPVFRVADPANPDNIATLSVKDHAAFQAKMQMATGQPAKSVKATRRIYRQAYLGRKLLEQGPAPCKEHFSFNCITGKRDRNSNAWYGLVRGMKDPQRWANKWLSQSLHILNSSAKGGVMAERGSFDNDADAEKSWAKHDEITWLKPGAQAAGKVQPKPQAAMPVGFYQLMEFAISSIQDTSGVNIETLGMRDAQQAASLDRQRKQSSMTILQPMFDSLRRYRKMQGRQMLYIIRTFLSDGRLVKIVGKDQEKYVPLTKSPDTVKYDVIVDDAPTSPNQKEATWAMMQQIIPAVGRMMTPPLWAAILEFSPLPTSAQQKIKDALGPPKGPDGQPLPPPPDPEIEKIKAQIIGDQQKAQADQALKQQGQQFDMNLAQQQAAAELENGRVRMANEIQLAREKMIAEQQLAREKAGHEAELAAYKADLMHEVAMKQAANQPAPASRN